MSNAVEVGTTLVVDAARAVRNAARHVEQESLRGASPELIVALARCCEAVNALDRAEAEAKR